MAAGAITVRALAVALVAAATLAIRVPTPATQGYINLGDSVIFVTALIFGARTGAVAGRDHRLSRGHRRDRLEGWSAPDSLFRSPDLSSSMRSPTCLELSRS